MTEKERFIQANQAYRLALEELSFAQTQYDRIQNAKIKAGAPDTASQERDLLLNMAAEYQAELEAAHMKVDACFEFLNSTWTTYRDVMRAEHGFGPKDETPTDLLTRLLGKIVQDQIQRTIAEAQAEDASDAHSKYRRV